MAKKNSLARRRVAFDLAFGADLNPTKIRARFKGMRSKASSFYSFDSPADMKATLPYWGDDYDCQKPEDAYEFIRDNMVQMLAIDYSCKNTIMNSGIVRDMPNNSVHKREYCWERNLENMAGEYICGKVDDCSFVNYNKPTKKDHFKSMTAKANLCFDMVCDDDIDTDYLWFQDQFGAVKTAFLNKFAKDFQTVLDNEVITIPNIKAIDQFNVYKFLIYLKNRIRKMCKYDSTKWIIAGNSMTLEPFELAQVYDGKSHMLEMVHGAEDGVVGMSMGMFKFVAIESMDDGKLLFAQEGAFRFWRNTFIYCGETDADKCSLAFIFTYVFKYQIIRSCTSYCNAYMLDFVAPTCPKEFTFDLTCASPSGAPVSGDEAVTPVAPDGGTPVAPGNQPVVEGDAPAGGEAPVAPPQEPVNGEAPAGDNGAGPTPEPAPAQG